MLEVKQVDNSNRQSVVDLIADHWGSSIVVTRGKVHHAKDRTGLQFMRTVKWSGSLHTTL